MNRHLSSEEISACIVGETGVLREHLDGCVECQSRATAFHTAVGGFRIALRDWDEAAEPMRPILATPSRPRPGKWSMAVAAIVVSTVSTVGILQVRERRAASDADAMLLTEISFEISREVPGPMEPLTQLVPVTDGSGEE